MEQNGAAYIDSTVSDLLDSEWDFETTFDGNNNFLKKAAQSCVIPITSAIMYLVLIHAGKAYMKNRVKFDLRNCLFAWSSFLAIFSIIGTYRCLKVVHTVYVNQGLLKLVCNGSTAYPIARFWGVIFLISKFVEFGDTAFIVLRKQHLSFLHWYHHITVMGFTWLCYGGSYAGSSVYTTMNLTVHSFMYSYYATCAWGIKPPLLVKKIITSLQIGQMVLGFSVVITVLKFSHPKTCPSSTLHLTYGLVMYFSYLVLFCDFFYKAYMRRPKVKAAKNANKSFKGNGEITSTTPQEIDNASLRKRPVK